MTSQLVSAIVAKKRLISYSEHHVNTEGTSGRTASREPMDGGEDKEKEERRGPDSSRSALRQRTCPDGLERGGL